MAEQAQVLECLDGLIGLHRFVSEARLKRFSAMKLHTMEWTSKIPVLSKNQINLNLEAMEAIHISMDQYDISAVRWAEIDTGEWGDSEAFSLAAGILIKFGELA